MTPEAKKQLEEMARKSDEPLATGLFMAGAQAAWDLAVKHEREIASALLRSLQYHLDIVKMHHNPRSGDKEKQK